MLPPWSVVFGIAFGAAIGSFLNVLIYRLPAGLSIVHPPSHCPNCKTRLTALDLFPILSYLVQQGRCRHCRASIPVRYLLVEIVNAAIWAWFWHLHLVQGESWVAFLGLSAFCSCLLALSMIDLRWFIIPDELNAAALIIGLLVAGFASRLATPWDWAEPGRLSLSNALIGATVGAGIFVFISLLGRIAFRKDAMGHGDIKLARAIGACLMAPAAVVSFGLAVMLGLVFGVVGMIYARLHPAIDTSEELESYVPESIASLFFFSILYLLWLDVLYLRNR